jgi:pyrroline-5-carboxylate reductase
MKIAIIGCGNMGQAYARSFKKYGLTRQEDLLLVIRNEDHWDRVSQLGNATMLIGPDVSECDLVILAVKPQDLNGITDKIAAVLKPEQVVLSIMAGITIKRLTESLGHGTVVRAMPNAPAQVGMGITAYTTGRELTMKQTLMVEQLLNCTGRAIHLGDEKLLDVVTALSGSGPAYFFEFVRAMVDTGIQLGLEPHIASALVMQTMLGSFHLMEHADTGPEELIHSVMSKEGTTEAAFKVLRAREFSDILQGAIKAANTRSMELSGV